MRAQAHRGLRKPQQPVVYGEIGLRGDDIQAVGLNGHAVSSLKDVHRRVSRQQFDQHALMGGVEVLNEHKRHAGVGRQHCE
jgi:hypothetical protein